MSAWLTPDLRPFYGGTYYPPTDQYGRPGFVTLLHALDDAYRNRKDEVERTAEQITGVLRRVAEPEPPSRPIRIDDAFVDELVARSVADYDSAHGGFGGAPKFPRETLLELLLVYLGQTSSSEITDLKSEVRKRVLHSLDALAAGGIRDHLGGGFHRYSTDAKWLVPHFEIMLYDNAMLAGCYVEAFRQTREPHYADVARGVLDFVLREMTSPDGAFYTAFDAEVDGQEGLNYLWTPAEVEAVLGADDAKHFNRVYGLDRGPNFADPHHGSGTPDKNILYLPEPVAADVNAARLEPMRQKLKAARDRRKQPLLDTKILTSWSALMIRALAYGGQVLGQPSYLAAARRASEFLLARHRTESGGLFRTSRDGRPKYDGFLDDYAYLVHAMLALDAAGVGPEWRTRAAEIASAMVDRFGDADENGTGGFYFTDRRSTDLIVRQKTATDSPLPSGNAVAAMSLLALGQADKARATITAFARQVEQNGEGMSAMVQAALLCLRQGGGPFTVAARGEHPDSVERIESLKEKAREVVEIGGDWVSVTELHIQLHIARGFHVNAHDPGGGTGASLVPTRIAVDAVSDSDVQINYPEGRFLDVPFAPEPVRAYDGDVAIAVRFAKPVTADVRLSLTYQPCDDTACLPPVTKRIEVPAP
jgi:uncharacterized protein YyaL (SSP411 family)